MVPGTAVAAESDDVYHRYTSTSLFCVRGYTGKIYRAVQCVRRRWRSATDWWHFYSWNASGRTVHSSTHFICEYFQKVEKRQLWVRPIEWLKLNKVCKLRGTSDTFVGRAYSMFASGLYRIQQVGTPCNYLRCTSISPGTLYITSLEYTTWVCHKLFRLPKQPG